MMASPEEVQLQGQTPLSVCPRCGRQVRIDGHCECESIFQSEQTLDR